MAAIATNDSQPKVSAFRAEEVAIAVPVVVLLDGSPGNLGKVGEPGPVEIGPLPWGSG
jgi:hypothetical protein